MGKSTVSWDDIPSLDNLEVDWDYQPVSPLGKRGSVRLLHKELRKLLGVENISVRVVTEKMGITGQLVDVSTTGVAILLDVPLTVSLPVKVGFFLGSQKVVVRALVKNSSTSGSVQRVGLEFVNLNEKASSFIISLVSSRIHQS